MSVFNNIRVPLKIALAFGVLCLIILASGAVSFISFANLRQADRQLEAVAEFNAAYDDFVQITQRQRQDMLSFMLTGEQAQLEDFRRLDERYKGVKTALARRAPEGFPRAVLDTLVTAEDRIHAELYERQIELMRHSDTVSEARVLEITTLPTRLFNARQTAMQEVHDWTHAALEAAEAQQSRANATMETATYASVIITLVLAVVLGLTLTRLIARPITGMNAFMTRLSDGDLSDAEVPGQGRRDEIGDMADAVAVFREGLIRARDLTEQQQHEHAKREHEQKELRRLVQSFEGTVISVLDGLSKADHLLRDTADRMSSGAEATMEKSDAAASAAAAASQDVNTVASSAEELSASIQEIARSVAEASTVASRAVAEADNSSREIEQLNESVARIGEVVGMISDIASQTNLLALNATIEAARAGDAGKGFAVVANEVKALATQTARATEDVSNQIGAIQSATQKAVTAIQKVTAIIRDIDEISSGIAAAVEEQGAATGEIARGAEHTASSTREVTSVMGELRDAAQDAGNVAKDLVESSKTISRQSTTLKDEVRDFLASVQHSDEDSEAALVEFSADHELGHPTIDEEHRELMRLTNELYRNIKSGSEKGVLDKAFRHLKTYASDHFAGEDAFMERSGYPQREQHQRHHAQFVQRLESLYEAYQEGDSTAGMDLLALLGSWWRSHMDEDDAALARFAQGRKNKAA